MPRSSPNAPCTSWSTAGTSYEKFRGAACEILQRIDVVLDFAHIKRWREEEAALRSVRKGLPRQTDKVEHFKAISYADIPAFMEELASASPTTGREALRFTIYNAVRSSATRKAV